MKKNGAAIAALLSGAIGVVTFGVLIIFAEAHPAVKTALTFDGPVGPLSGKTLLAVMTWGLSWAVLHALWRQEELQWDRWWKISAGTLIAGFLLCFPPIYDFLAKIA